jgi:hypothetical protein
MIRGRVIWPPYPYEAGFCVTDDTDAATYEQVRAVYEFLLSRRFVTTKTVWPFLPSDRCGIPPTPQSTLRGITLQDERYHAFCKMLHDKGYEICLHGASAGNNLRESTIRAFDFVRATIGPADTFICHAKNADNMYWNEKITSLFPFNCLIKLVSRYESSGEIPTSPYFWGDICRDTIQQIRLYRTRCVNTLRKNPSMPYYCYNRPYVNGWFSATKRSIGDCAQQEEQEKLVEQNGLTVLYQYLHRYADPNGRDLNKRFVDAIDSLVSNDAIKIDTVSNTMERLRALQRTFILYNDTYVWIVNANRYPLKSFQMVFDRPADLSLNDGPVKNVGHTAVIDEIPAQTIMQITSNAAICVQGRRCFPTHGKKRICHNIAHARLYVNLSESVWHVSNALHMEPGSFSLQMAPSLSSASGLSSLPLREELSLLTGQMWIIAREMLFKNRSLNSDKYLDGSKEIMLENHDNW